jgi:hypothetical protein
MATFHEGDRVVLATVPRATGRGPAELGTDCRSPNPTPMKVRVVWDSHPSNAGLY